MTQARVDETYIPKVLTAHPAEHETSQARCDNPNPRRHVSRSALARSLTMYLTSTAENACLLHSVLARFDSLGMNACASTPDVARSEVKQQPTPSAQKKSHLLRHRFQLWSGLAATAVVAQGDSSVSALPP